MIATNYEIASLINRAPLSFSTADLIDEIEEKYDIRLNYSTVQNFRKTLPKIKRKESENSRKELLSILMLIISILKMQSKI